MGSTELVNLMEQYAAAIGTTAMVNSNSVGVFYLMKSSKKNSQLDHVTAAIAKLTELISTITCVLFVFLSDILITCSVPGLIAVYQAARYHLSLEHVYSCHSPLYADQYQFFDN